jgi:hypothetical protein
MLTDSGVINAEPESQAGQKLKRKREEHQGDVHRPRQQERANRDLSHNYQTRGPRNQRRNTQPKSQDGRVRR